MTFSGQIMRDLMAIATDTTWVGEELEQALCETLILSGNDETDYKALGYILRTSNYQAMNLGRIVDALNRREPGKGDWLRGQIQEQFNCVARDWNLAKFRAAIDAAHPSGA